MKFSRLTLLMVLGFYGGVESYAQTVTQCDAEIGITVPEFDCNDGAVVPTTINGDEFTYGVDYGSEVFSVPSQCDRPNVLNGTCDPGSRFQVIADTPDAYVVAHCRRQGSEEGIFPDTAVIQYNKVTGATCFYQSFGSGASGVRGAPNNVVSAPSTGSSRAPLVGGGCMTCHDNGPLIRTPYLTQMDGEHVIPGAGDINFNKDQPYFIVGHEQKKTYSVDAGNGCTACHGLSLWGSGSNVSIANSAGGLAIAATKQSQASKTPTSAFAPMWMSLAGAGGISYDPASFAAAQDVVACGASVTDLNNLPNTSSCTVEEKLGRLRKPLSLVSASGQCADLHSGYFNNIFPDAPVVSYECYGSNLNQKWTYTADRTFLSEDGRCLSATGINNGATVNATTCSGSTSQKWGYNAYTGKVTNDNAPGKCLDIWNTGTMEHNQTIQLWDCNGQRNQRWAMADLQETYIENDSAAAESLNIQTQVNGVSVLKSGAIQSGWWSAQWTIERVGDNYRIRNRWKKNEFLHIENGPLKAGEIQPGWLSAEWVLRGAPKRGSNVYSLQSAWKPWLYISLDTSGDIQVADKSQAQAGTLYWKLNGL